MGKVRNLERKDERGEESTMETGGLLQRKKRDVCSVHSLVWVYFFSASISGQSGGLFLSLSLCNYSTGCTHLRQRIK